MSMFGEGHIAKEIKNGGGTTFIRIIHHRVLIPSGFDEEQVSGSIPKCGKTIKDSTPRLPEHCEITKRDHHGFDCVYSKNSVI